jgi:hypothetical protein
MSLTHSLPLRLLLFYGLGHIIDIGVYVLLGEGTGLAGCYAPIWCSVVSTVTGFTALSYTKAVLAIAPECRRSGLHP